MAYQSNTKYSGKSNQAATTATTSGATKTAALFTTGLWAQEKGPAMASVQVKEDVTIPAGSYLNVYDNRDSKKTATGPDFRITVKAGKLKTQG